MLILVGNWRTAVSLADSGVSTGCHNNYSVHVSRRKTMERWSGRVALVTGGSAGIGAAIVRRLASRGLSVIACARRVDMIQVFHCKSMLNQQNIHRVK